MYVIFKKELKSFFSNVTGYIVIALFLVANALFLWILPGQWNVFDSGYASLDALFFLAPWLYLFLCPAVTMRFFAEEKAEGTLELLLTKPISRLNIVGGKALAGWVLVIVALLPSLIWYLSIYILAEPMGNVDSGAFWGSWIGLLFLAMVYVAIGVFGSSLSSSQVVAFMVSAFISFALFYGFELIGSLFSGETAYWLRQLGINEHYKSISRGVIDSRDLVYFLALTFGFIYLTTRQIKSK
jgi:ABC-2 type transport system permease protein